MDLPTAPTHLDCHEERMKSGEPGSKAPIANSPIPIALVTISFNDFACSVLSDHISLCLMGPI